MKHAKSSYLLAILILALLFPSVVASGQTAAMVSYHLRVRIDPAAGSLAVEGSVKIPPEDFKARSLAFYLDETLSIRKLLIDGKEASFKYGALELTRLTPARRWVIVTLPPGISPGSIRMEIGYGGVLKKLPEFGAAPEGEPAMDDRINAHLVQLAVYSSWYPQFEPEGAIRSDFEVSLPAGWIAICSGRKLGEQAKQGRAITRWSSPRDTDILIVASPDFKEKSFRQAGVNIEIYYTRMPQEFIDAEVRQVADVVKLYTDLLGETHIPGGSVRHVYSPLQKGQGMAGIARPGLIVTSEGRTLDGLKRDPHFSLFQPIAHEIGHFWWSFGFGQGDWINEAFAEYFSAVAVQKVESEKEFQAVIENYRKRVRELPTDAPSLATVPFSNDQVGFVVRYYKGALMLNQLRKVLGDEKFFRDCREFFETYRARSATTADFRSFWEKKLGAQKKALDDWIDSRGGLPAS